MATQSLLAKIGMRSQTLGSPTSLAIAMPIAEGAADQAAHTAANRSGWYGGQTPGAELIGMIIGGQQGPVWTRNSGGGTDEVFTGRLLQTGVAYLGLASGVELSDVILNEAQVKQFATSVPTTQRTVLIDAATYSCDTAGQTITTAATLAVSGPPIAGTNVTITNAYALWVQQGNVLFAGTATTLSSTAGAFVVGNGTAATSVSIGAGNIVTGAVVSVGNNATINGTSSAYSSNTTCTVGRGNSGTFVANSMYLQSGGTTTAGGGFYWGLNNGTTTSTIMSLLTGGALALTPNAVATGAQTAFTITGASNTLQTSTTEVHDIFFNLARAVQWTTAPPVTQRAVYINAPTYTCDTATQTITTADTFAISGSPVGGTNVAITNSFALRVESGTSRFDGSVQFTGANSIVVTQTASASGIPSIFAVSGGANTGVTSATEDVDVNFNLSHTVTWATSTPTTQRAFLIQAPTYACNTAAQTIATAATFAITGAPVAGTNVTITSKYALWVQTGAVELDGNVTIKTTLPLNIIQTASASGSPSCFAITGAASTSLTSGTEANDVIWNLARTVTWATSTPTTQRAVVIQAPTYACDTAAQTIATAATFAVSGAPAAGTNVTITAALALWVQAGLSKLNGPFAVIPAAVSSGSATAFEFDGAVNTGQTSATEVFDVAFKLARTVTWATSTPTTQRAFVITAPTYACNTATQTIATAATLAISGAPVAGSNVTLTSSYALWVQAGGILFAGPQTNTAAFGLTLTPAVSNAINPSMLTATAAADTAITSGAESISVNFNLAATRQWATTTPALQRAVNISAPTYSCNAVTQTIANSATLYIQGAPIAGTNVTITNSYALEVAAGNVLFNGIVTNTEATSTALSPAFICAGTSTITAGVTDGVTSNVKLSPTYNAATAQTVTRHNYITLSNPVLGGAGPAAVTNAAVFQFDAAIGTHKALLSPGATAVTFTSLGPTGAATTIQGWMQINVNGTLHYIPFW
jgi:hypothetical protein